MFVYARAHVLADNNCWLTRVSFGIKNACVSGTRQSSAVEYINGIMGEPLQSPHNRALSIHHNTALSVHHLVILDSAICDCHTVGGPWQLPPPNVLQTKPGANDNWLLEAAELLSHPAERGISPCINNIDNGRIDNIDSNQLQSNICSINIDSQQHKHQQLHQELDQKHWQRIIDNINSN